MRGLVAAIWQRRESLGHVNVSITSTYLHDVIDDEEVVENLVGKTYLLRNTSKNS